MAYLYPSIPYYVYKVVCRPTGQFYFGSRYSHVTKGITPVDDLWKTYFTSSLIVKDLISLYEKNNFDAVIIETFTSKIETFLFEQSLIAHHLDDPLCLNLNVVKLRKGAKFHLPAGLSLWTNIKTGQQRFFKKAPNSDWVPGRLSSSTAKAYNKNGKVKYFENNPGDGWVIGALPKLGSLRFGNSYNLNKLWWNNGTKSVLKHTWPGIGWNPGRLSWKNKKPVTTEWREKVSKANKGKKAYNNGEKTIMAKEHPGAGWTEGPLLSSTTSMRKSLAMKGKPSNTLGMSWWNNGIISTLTKACPGDGWVKGRYSPIDSKK